MPTVRLLVAMILGALVAALGALFLGEYEFDEALPIAAGPLLAYVVAEIVVSIGKQRSPMLAVVLAGWSVAAVLLAGHLDANGVDPIKGGAYLSAALAGVVALLRGNAWFAGRRRRAPAPTTPDL